MPQVLRLLKDFILFAEKDEELQKFILRQHQMGGVEKVVERALYPQRTRGLVWHTQGSGKTYTMIKSAEMLFKAPEAEKPTILLMIDRNELEDQMLKNLASVGLGNVAHAEQHRGAEPATAGGLPGHHRDDDPQVPRHAGEPEPAEEHLRAH